MHLVGIMLNMRYLASLLLISFIGVSFLGFIIFNYSMSHSQDNRCIASLIDGNKCPSGATDLAIHQISAIQIFSNTLISPNFHLFLIFSFLIFSLLLFLFFKKLNFYESIFLAQKWRISSMGFHSNKLRTNYWLSLLENSPTYSY